MNRYPWWKYLILGLALLIGLLYTLPNLYGEAPAVQVSSGKATVKVDGGLVPRIEQTLTAVGLKPDFVQFEGNSVKARFGNTDDQIKAKDAIAKALNPDAANPSYIVALNLLSRTPQWMAAINAKPMFLGLDLRGGVHFLLQVDMKSAMSKKAESNAVEIRSMLRDKQIRHAGIARDGNGVNIRFRDQDTLKKALGLLQDRLPDLAWAESTDGADLVLAGSFKPAAQKAVVDEAVQQNITTLHKRVNELGTNEPVIQQQGADRIVVQLPGVQDTARAKGIIGRTATLQFRLVDPSTASAAEVVPQRDGSPVGLVRDVIANGDQLKEAAAIIDQDQRPAVSVTLDDIAGRVMRNVTRENLGKPMAIVLYEKGKGEAISVARINGEFGTKFQITGNFTPEETADLALLTRAGALAAPMEIIEERTIGPSLGADNIAKGFASVGYGFAAIAVFMCGYYLLFGMFSTLALGFNLLLLVSLLSMLQATLTLPGIAAIALTLGMAIDANVLINERVREELRGGASAQAAINAGYERAFATILDSNITTLIAGLALLAFGSGFVRGFAVVHCLGILTSMFSAVMFSRGLVNLWYGGQKRLKSVSIGQVWRPAGAPAANVADGDEPAAKA